MKEKVQLKKTKEKKIINTENKLNQERKEIKRIK